MKIQNKILGIVIALTLLVAMAIPVLAVNTGVDVGVGVGDAPTIQVKWETPDNDLTKPGTQVDPPLAFEAEKAVQYWAIVTAPAGKENIAAVYVDVWHPETQPDCGSFKYQLRLQKVDKATVGIPAFQSAWNNGTIHPDSWGENPDTGLPYTYAEVAYELTQSSNDVYMVEGILHYHQPAGDYKVQIKAVDKQNVAAFLTNYMEYVAISAIEIDFTSLYYGPITVGNWKQIDGDKTFAVPAAPAGHGLPNKATVRNIGNTNSQITVHQSDLYNEDGLPLGKTGTDWNVEYGARLGGTEATRVNYFPSQTIALPDILPLCNTQKLDFWIQINKFGTTGHWAGTMTIGSVIVPFEPCEEPEQPPTS